MSSTCNDYQWLSQRIAATEAQIEAYEDAALQLGSGSVQSYTLDTGQSRQTVTKMDLADLHTTIDSLYNRRATLIARRDGCGVINVRPCW